MRKGPSGTVIYSPSDLVRYIASPYSSWMDRYHLEHPDQLAPDAETEDQRLIADTGIQHEKAILAEFKAHVADLVEISGSDFTSSQVATLEAIGKKAPIIYQAALQGDRFAGFADFVILGDGGTYQIWDTKLARSPKPYYAIQLCCYSEMFTYATGSPLPTKFGVILGTRERVEFRVEDFIHYYRRVRDRFLTMQDNFTGDVNACPEPQPGADHGRWTSHAEQFFEERDHLCRVAGITVGQIKKLRNAGISTLTALAGAAGKAVPKLGADTLEKLASQARLQLATLTARASDPEAAAAFEVLPSVGLYEPTGLASLPKQHAADVFFDMEGYPLAIGGLEYLFGVCFRDGEGVLQFADWWAHDRDDEKLAFEGFIDWAFERWRTNPGMHIYHYAAYEVSAIRRLSTRHDTHQDEVDELLRHEVFVDLYQVVRHGLRIGEDSYSIKKVERLYRPRRKTEVATAADSIVQYARWIESGQSRRWAESSLLKNIRDYNEDDCKSTAELLTWLVGFAAKQGIQPSQSRIATASSVAYEPKDLPPEVIARLEIIKKLRAKGDDVAITLSDLMDFHRREEKPMWWRMFDRANKSTPEELWDDTGCIEGIEAMGSPTPEKQSLIQTYSFDPSQECKLSAGENLKVMFTHALDAKFTLIELDSVAGELKLKIGKKSIAEKFDGSFPSKGSLIPDEYVSAKAIQTALTEVAEKHLSDALHAPVLALLTRMPPASQIQSGNETSVNAAIRLTNSMSGKCLVVQGPPGTGKTYTASHVINALVARGKRVGVASNSHKAVVNLLTECGDAIRKAGGTLHGVKVGGDDEGPLFADNPSFRHIGSTGDAIAAYSGGIIGGTAWLFTRPEWAAKLDFLFIDEAGQVSLANIIAMSRATDNVVLLGDQMQLEQPIQGSHPGDSGLSGLQYALKDLTASKEDHPIFHSVVPSDYGLFLGESRRMHPSVCSFISESIYDGRLGSFIDCAQQRVAVSAGGKLICKENGIVFSPIEHDGNIQQSEEEVERVVEIYEELRGLSYTASDGKIRPLALDDFLFITPYNAQVRALKAALPEGARVGSVDKFQGQQAPVCILSLCSSFGEYGSRGLAFILDRNRLNVAISRAQCLAIVVADSRIATTHANSLSEMALVNLFCKLTAS